MLVPGRKQEWLRRGRSRKIKSISMRYGTSYITLRVTGENRTCTENHRYGGVNAIHREAIAQESRQRLQASARVKLKALVVAGVVHELVRALLSLLNANALSPLSNVAATVMLPTYGAISRAFFYSYLAILMLIITSFDNTS